MELRADFEAYVRVRGELPAASPESGAEPASPSMDAGDPPQVVSAERVTGRAADHLCEGQRVELHNPAGSVAYPRERVALATV